MKSRGSRVAVLCALTLVVLVWAGSSPARDRMRAFDGFRAATGQEVLNGSYFCSGTIYTDEQRPNVTVGSWLGATSGITSDLAAPYYSTFSEVGLPEMGAQCAAHVEEVQARLSRSCATGELRTQGGEFGNGENVSTEFQFSCLGKRDEIIEVIGALGRSILGVRFE